MALRLLRAPCSPYLKKPLRTLKTACLHAAKEHGFFELPCRSCGLRDLCRLEGAISLASLPRLARRRLPPPASPKAA